MAAAPAVGLALAHPVAGTAAGWEADSAAAMDLEAAAAVAAATVLAAMVRLAVGLAADWPVGLAAAAAEVGSVAVWVASAAGATAEGASWDLAASAVPPEAREIRSVPRDTQAGMAMAALVVADSAVERAAGVSAAGLAAGWVAGWEAAMGTGAKPPLRRQLRCP